MLRYLLLVSILLFNAFYTDSLNNGLVLTPPMGWIHWERFQCNVDCDEDPYNCLGEYLIKSTADALVNEGYAALGYKYIIIDDCWPAQQRDPVTQKLVPDPKRFPSGMKALADYIHSLGLKFGLYQVVGKQTCARYPGSEFYMQLDAQTFADWGVDYMKIDGCNVGGNWDQIPLSYEAYGYYLNRTGRPIVYSCEWPLYAMAAGQGVDYRAVANTCNSWRTGVDIQVAWWSVCQNIDIMAANKGDFIHIAGPGAWNDADMLVLGNMGLSEAQERTSMAFYSLWSSSLLISADIRPNNMPPGSKALLQNANLIRINQDPLGKSGEQILTRSTIHVWRKQLTESGSFAFVFFNRFDGGAGTWPPPSRISFSLSTDLGLTNPKGYLIYEAFTDTLLGLYSINNTFSVKLLWFDSYMIRVRPASSELAFH